MKIAFTGTHGIGKTTLATWLASTLDVTYIPEFAREFLENGFQLHSPTDLLDFETQILRKKIECEQKALSLNTQMVADRSYLDYSVYLKHGLSRFPYEDIKDLAYKNQKVTHYFNEYESECLEHNKIYDIIFFVTPFTEFISPEFDYREKNPFATNIIQDLLFNEYHNDLKTGNVVLIREKDLLERKKVIIRTLKERSFLPWNKTFIDEEL
ncbi:MAG: ATP/GTP-binding protein [Brevinema sp.]